MKDFIKRNIIWLTFFGSSIITLVVALVTSIMMLSSSKIIEETTKQNLLALSRAAALLTTADELDQYAAPEDMERPEYKALSKALIDFNTTSGTEFTYFLRLDEARNKMQFIIDNSPITTALREAPVPREEAPDIALAGIANTVALGSYSEGWEGYMTAYAPVYYKDGRLSNTIAGVDMLDVNIRAVQQNMRQLSFLLIMSILLGVGSCMLSLLLYRKKAKQAMLASEAKSTFLSQMSHEIRTPMNAILGMTELIMHDNPPESILAHATDIRSACRGLLAIINDVLDISKIESGKLEIVPSQYHISSLLLDVISIIKTHTDKKTISFITKIDASIPSELYGDEIRIKQILINLLTNAVKFTHEGHVVLTANCKKEDDECLFTFSVADTGVGIKPEDLLKVFVLFQQVDTKRNRNIEGTGLGLSISRQLAEMMGGTLVVESKFGVGSTFTATVRQKIVNPRPVAVLKKTEESSVLVFENRHAYLSSVRFSLDSLGCKYDICSLRSEMRTLLNDATYKYLLISSLYVDAVQELIKEKQPNAVIIVLSDDRIPYYKGNIFSISMPIHCLQLANIFNDEYTGHGSTTHTSHVGNIIAPNAKVLVVDDNTVNLKVAVGLLSLYKIQADTASGGHRAVEMVRETEYDLIFMDHMMPDMDGIDTTVAIRGLGQGYADIPIVALTANAVGDVKEMFKAEGMNDFLAKPVEMSKLDSILRKWLPENLQQAREEAIRTEEEYCEISGVDTRRGMKNSGGVSDNYTEILDFYVADCRNRLVEIETYHKEGNIKALIICVHALKSASANIGADDMSSMALALETAGKAADTGYIDANLRRFCDSLAVLVDNIQNYLNTLQPDEPVREKAADMDFLRATVADIEGHMERLDLESIEGAIKTLSPYQWGEGISAQISTIKERIAVFDYEGVEASVAGLKALC